MKLLTLTVLSLLTTLPALAGNCTYNNILRFKYLYVYGDENQTRALKCKYTVSSNDENVWHYDCADGSTATINVKQNRMVHSEHGVCVQPPRMI